MKNLDHIRHSLAHILAMAILKKFPDAKLGIGPVIEHGFYYDFEIPQISEDLLPTLEQEMKKLVKQNLVFTGKKVTVQEAKKIFKNQPFKLELIDEFAKEEKELTVYKTCPPQPSALNPIPCFTDLCRGGHVKNTKEIDPESFALMSVAGAYWKGSEKSPMLTRIYGVAFASKKELASHLAMLEEAKKRDHKKLGKDLDLFIFSDLVGPGLPLWTPRGTLMRSLLDEALWKLRRERGYERVEIPHITKKDLYEKSGHWDKFKDELFKITSREGHEFAMKPMNCPHHIQIYDHLQRSYRDLPQRYSNTTMCYRDEQTGELSGLSRLRSFTQDDSHVFCRNSQIKEDVTRAWEIIDGFYKQFNLEMAFRLSLHDPKHPKQYLGTPELWRVMEESLRSIAKQRKVTVEEAKGEAAFYGPKIDFIAKDSLGREWQLATIQLDMNLPERFSLYCIDEKGKKERIVMLHIAIMGSIERFLSIIIEHYGGAFPYWLAPEQVRVLPISDEQADYALHVQDELLKHGVRAHVDKQGETIGKKIREGQLQKIPYLLIVGKQEQANKTVNIRSHNDGVLGEKTVEGFLKMLR